MNTAVFVNFLRHLLFLLVILQIIGGIILFETNISCTYKLTEHELFPWNLNVPRHAIFLAYSHLHTFINMTEISVILTYLLGFLGAIYLHSHPIINFAATVNMMVCFLGQFTAGYSMTYFIESLDFFMVRLKDVFHLANTQDKDKMAEYNVTMRDASFSLGMKDEWSVLAGGSEENHTVIDYLQLTVGCCGLTGRDYWRIKIPTSCCQEEARTNCILSKAHSTSCSLLYDNFRSCLKATQIESIIFALLTIAAVLVAVCLGRIKAKYPNEDYDSESSSSGSEDMY